MGEEQTLINLSFTRRSFCKITGQDKLPLLLRVKDYIRSDSVSRKTNDFPVKNCDRK